MSEPGIAHLHFDELTLEGCSVAGEQTWFKVSPPGIAFDGGRGHPALSGVDSLFLSHGHLDHALGIPFLLSRRSLENQPSLSIHCPAEIAPVVDDLIRAAAALERASYSWEIVPLSGGDRVSVGRDLEIEAFSVSHVVPGLGFHLRRTHRRLRPELTGATPEKLVQLKNGGAEIEIESSELWLSYCGDTTAAVLDDEPRLLTSRILVLECTFIAPEHRDRALEYGHIHLEDILERADRFENEALVLHHLSRRHRPTELEQQLLSRAPQLAERVHVLNGGRDG